MALSQQGWVTVTPIPTAGIETEETGRTERSNLKQSLSLHATGEQAVNYAILFVQNQTET